MYRYVQYPVRVPGTASREAYGTVSTRQQAGKVALLEILLHVCRMVVVAQ